MGLPVFRCFGGVNRLYSVDLVLDWIQPMREITTTNTYLQEEIPISRDAVTRDAASVRGLLRCIFGAAVPPGVQGYISLYT